MTMIKESALFNIDTCRENFPILQSLVHGKPLAYLDNAATTQKPELVIAAIDYYYRENNSNVHRGLYELSERATILYEESRQKVRHFINAKHNHEIIFTRGTTESVNLVAHSFGKLAIESGDEIIVSAMEHHSNFVPWQLLCQERGAHLKVIPVKEDATLDMDAFDALLNPRVKLVAVVHISNATGVVNPVEVIIEKARALDIPVFLDGAQVPAHRAIDVTQLDCDFYTLSGHKMYAPMGIGVLYAKEKWLEQMPPYQSGGDMIRRVTVDSTEFNLVPHKFEAGTPNVAGAIGLAAAIDYIASIGYEAIVEHENVLMDYARWQLSAIEGLHIVGPDDPVSSVISFVMDCAHPHDIGTILDSEGVAIRAGFHCAMPLMDQLGINATARASLAIYNNKSDIDQLARGLEKVVEVFGGEGRVGE